MKLYRILILLTGMVLLADLSGCGFVPGFHDPDGDWDSKGAMHFPMSRPATGKRVFVFDPRALAWAVYDGQGSRMNTGRATGGKPYCPDVGRSCRTVTGVYRIIRKGDRNCVSSRYPVKTRGGAPMPYCMYFHPKGYAIHGTSSVPDYYNSHGCIGVTTRAARWLHNNLPLGSTVIIKSY